MDNYGYVRLRAPREAKSGEVVQVKALVTHPMEGIERDDSGKVRQKNYHLVYRMTSYFNDRVVVTVTPTQSVSENPFFSFKMRVTESGTLRVVFEDTFGKQYEASREITVTQ